MKALLLVLTLALSVQAFAAPKRYNIRNKVTNRTFMVERDDGVLGKINSQWGLPRGERPCADLTPGEGPLVLSRRTVKSEGKPDVELCTVDDHFEIVETDLTVERAQERTRKEAKKAKLQALMQAKDKPSLTKAEQDQILLFLLKEYLGEN